MGKSLKSSKEHFQEISPNLLFIPREFFVRPDFRFPAQSVGPGVEGTKKAFTALAEVAHKQ